MQLQAVRPICCSWKADHVNVQATEIAKILTSCTGGNFHSNYATIGTMPSSLLEPPQHSHSPSSLPCLLQLQSLNRHAKGSREFTDVMERRYLQAGRGEVKACVALFTRPVCAARVFFITTNTSTTQRHPSPLLSFYAHTVPIFAPSSINMPFAPGSLEDVEAWAQRDFPTYFAALSTFPIAEDVDTSKFDGEYVDGRIILQSVLVLALDVGVTAAGMAVYARITGSSDVELFCDHKVKAPEDVEDLLCIKPVAGLDGIKLAAPFCHCTESGQPAPVCIDRLEALIRYAHLKAGEEEAVRPKLGFFKAHFRGACCDVARGTGALTEADEMADDEMLPGKRREKPYI